jgi:hypothetical protein
VSTRALIVAADAARNPVGAEPFCRTYSPSWVAALSAQASWMRT